MTSKWCKRCDTTKPLAEFYFSNGKPYSYCKPCARDHVRKMREKNVDYYRAFDTARRRNDPERRAAVCRAANARRRRDPVAANARARLNVAVQRGLVKRAPCRDCGRKDVHGHHADYGKPLDVVWLCPVHHAAEHKRLAAAKA